MSKAPICLHEVCHCALSQARVNTGDRFCSDSCMRAFNAGETTCACGHAGCEVAEAEKEDARASVIIPR